MKTLYAYLILISALISVNFASAQTGTVKYLSKSKKKEVPVSEAHYFEIEEKNDLLGGTRTCFLLEDSSKVRLFTYSHLKGGVYGQGILDGPYYEWHENGKLKTEATYVKDELQGEYKSWYESGALHYTKNYKNYKLEDTLTAYYESGKLRRVEVYADNRLVSGKLYDESGNEMKFFPMEQMPRFPGGEQRLMKLISRNLKYPESAQKREVGGVVIVSFVVQEDGLVGDVEVVASVDPELDAEAIRVINTLPNWEPGLVEGKPTALSFTLPLRFVANKKW